MIEWKKYYKSNTGYERYNLKRYPFINVSFSKCGDEYELDYMFGHYNQPKFKSLDKIKQYIENRVLKSFDRVNLDKIKTLDELNRVEFIDVSYTTWCNNNGDGKYIGNKLYEKYHWIEGRQLLTTATYHSYAIRFDRFLPEAYVKSRGIGIVKRHIRRFKKQMNY